MNVVGSRTQAWLVAARPQTLPAGASPVIVGTAVAVHEGLFAAGPALAALVSALLIQVGTNLANDYYDAVKGVDTDDREGFTRVTQAGLIQPDRVRIAAFASFGLAVLLGFYLVAVGGLPVVAIGLASVVSGYAYAGGPYPLGSHGLGDLFVFVFFGVLAVTGTVYVQAAAAVEGFLLAPPEGSVPPASVVASLAMGGLSTCIMIVNNVRDLETDRAAGKRTLAVLIGYRWSRIEFAAMLALAYVVPLALWLAFDYPVGVLLPVATVPGAVLLTRTVWTERTGDALNPALERTGQLLFVYSLAFVVGLTVIG